MKLLLLLVSTALSLLLAEGALRVLDPSARQIFSLGDRIESERGKFCHYDEKLGWAGNPDAESLFEWVDCRHRVRQNKYGFRGSEYEFPRGPKKRMCVLGDSFVWGFGVEQEQIFTSVLERLSGDSVEVVNLGVSGYGTDQELLLWRELGKRFQPDVVLLVITPYTDLNDIDRNNAYGIAKPFFAFSDGGRLELTNVPVPNEPWPTREGKPPVGKSFLARVASHSSLVASVLMVLARSDGVRGYLEDSGVLVRRLGGYRWEPHIHTVPPAPEIERSWLKTAMLVGMLRKEVEAAGATLVVTAVPSAMQIYEDHWQAMIQDAGMEEGITWSRDAPTERVGRICSDAGIPFIDLTPALRDAGKSDPYLYYSVNRHWTASGHRTVAGTLARKLELFQRPSGDVK